MEIAFVDQEDDITKANGFKMVAKQDEEPKFYRLDEGKEEPITPNPPYRRRVKEQAKIDKADNEYSYYWFNLDTFTRKVSFGVGEARRETLAT
eukprot:CAMPEP_0114594492 /NCGR_PEP_ID=MMETSP0125-20121206/16142_1 /TAXON_ID=485358 ORGANISM="Aristerostoma sp., Strain ATCC 50986" /NCGR_SAMPLE_ID=MMETSP0125 /ASSEMBLY_ACC=CAM_ASM_000245 /LENGTH=92 /DNA_ID=CAMNT_0001794837 /DNA_START=119 /DNA_END=393 /DNA_ORIENTATION=+